MVSLSFVYTVGTPAHSCDREPTPSYADLDHDRPGQTRTSTRYASGPVTHRGRRRPNVSVSRRTEDDPRRRGDPLDVLRRGDGRKG